MKTRKWMFTLLAGLLLGAVAYWVVRPAPVPVEIATLARGTFALTLEEDGITRVRDRYVVTTPVAGLLLRPTLRAGDTVHRGDLVATILPNAVQWLAIIGLGLGPTGLAFLAWDHATKHGRLSLLGSLSYLSPLLSTLLLILCGRAAASWQILLAAVLIIVGAVVATGMKRRQAG